MRKFITASAISVLGLIFATGTVFASVSVTGNGASSINAVTVHSFVLSSFSKTNVATFTNNVNTKTKTGHNSSSFNTGGSNTVISGGAATDVSVNNIANVGNDPILPECLCSCLQLNTSDQAITGNGADSINSIVTSTKCITKVETTNVANVINTINTKTNTGGNNSSFNTGGDSSVVSGDASTTVNVTNVANTTGTPSI